MRLALALLLTITVLFGTVIVGTAHFAARTPAHGCATAATFGTPRTVCH